MNRLVCSTSETIDAAKLPPRDRAGGGVARVLFLHTRELGFATASKTVTHYCAGHPGIDGVHVFVDMPWLLRAACAASPVGMGGLDLHAARQTWAWRAYLRRLTAPRGPFPLERFDAVHVFTQQRGLFAEALARDAESRRTKNHPAIVINADATLPAWDRVFPTPRAWRSLDESLEKRAFAAATATACWSRWVSDSVATDYGVDARKLFLYRPCVRTDTGPAPQRAQRTAGLVRLVFVGNDWERKGGPRLVHWHQQRWADRAELHVCSATAPADTSHTNVIYHGPTPHDKLIREILPAMDVFVLPTRCDTFVIAAQEAQAAGLPVVSSRVAGVPEVVADGVSGVLCAPDDDQAFIAAIDRLIADASWREHLSRGATHHAAKNLNAEVWHRHLLDQIVRVANGQPVEFSPPGVEL